MKTGVKALVFFLRGLYNNRAMNKQKNDYRLPDHRQESQRRSDTERGVFELKED